jgi:hypothetical protein
MGDQPLIGFDFAEVVTVSSVNVIAIKSTDLCALMRKKGRSSTRYPKHSPPHVQNQSI